MEKLSYEYAHGDLIEDRQTYFYSDFKGEDFLESWETSRAEVLTSLPVPVAAPSVQSDINEKYFEGEHNNYKATDIYITESLLEHLLYALTDKGERQKETEEKSLSVLNALVKRFEVSKRIYQSYDVNLHANDKAEYHDLGLYIRFAEVCEKAYEKYMRLPFLNVLLKTIDTLCALHLRLDSSQKGRLAYLIQSERKHIERLSKKCGVSKL